MLAGGRAFGREQVDIIVHRNQSPDAGFGAAPDGVAGGEHALGGGNGDVSEQFIAAADDGQEIPGRWQGKSDKLLGVLDLVWRSDHSARSHVNAQAAIFSIAYP